MKDTDFVKWAREIIATAPEDCAAMVAEDPSVLDVCGRAIDAGRGAGSRSCH